ncbi:MAG: tail fiber domain-containing protein [Gemmatimonadaceae bacterium]|nr:tail fiber domain-containing protein [Gemmatimonadaceae bacterium]
MPTVTPMPMPYFQGLDASGRVLTSGFVRFYEAGTGLPQTVYQDALGLVPHPDPVPLNSSGIAVIYWDASRRYKFELFNSAMVSVRSVDFLPAMPTTDLDLDLDGIAGEPILARQPAYLETGTGPGIVGRWYLTNSAAVGTSTTAGRVGFALANLLTGETGLFRVQGRLEGFSGLTTGAIIYAGTPAGTITTVVPANARVIAQADAPTSLLIAANEAIAASRLVGVLPLDVQAAITQLGAVTAPTLNGFTFNQSVASGSSPALTGTNIGGILEANIADGALLARLASAEIVAGLWTFSQPIRGADGTAAAPQYSFNTDPNTGIYREFADEVSVAAGGVKAARFFISAEGPSSFVGASGMTYVTATNKLKLITTAGLLISGLVGTASAANVNYSGGELLVVTSSRRWKTDIAPIPLERARRLLDISGVTFRSTLANDNPDQEHIGFIAEDVAVADPSLATYDAKGLPNGVNYDRVPAVLLELIKGLEARVQTLEARVQALEAGALRTST